MQAVEGRQFHVCSIKQIQKGIELLTGIPAESMDEKDVFHGYLESRIRENANALKTEKAE